MRLSIFHSTSRALREFFLVLVQGYERAPRVSQLPILKQQDLCQFKLSTEFEIIEYDSCINFCFGVYIKDDSGNSYLFGNNSMNYVCFEHTGVDSGITESYVNENKFKIEIYCNGKELRLRYIESSNISIVFNKKVKLYGNVFQIGITCKTWGALGKFEGIANNILFQEG